MQLYISSKLAKLDANRNELNCAEQYSTALRKVSHHRPNYPCRVLSAAAVRANIGNAVSREQSTPHIEVCPTVRTDPPRAHATRRSTDGFIIVYLRHPSS